MRRRILGSFCLALVSNLFSCHLWNLSTIAASATKTRAWLPHDVPNPDQKSCHSGESNRLCDPDLVFSANDVERLTTALGDSPSRRVSLPGACLEMSTSQDYSVEVQYGVAVLKKMDLDSTAFAAHRDNPDAAAEIFARQIHDSWGVGLETQSCGGTGILLFLSIEDRTIFISRGTALESVFTNRRLDRTIDDMKPFLVEQDYGLALLLAVRALDAYLRMGEPNWYERSAYFLNDHLGYFVVVGLVALGVMYDLNERRKYAAVSSYLHELDLARAEALKGRFNTKSCPICLGVFQPPPNSPDNKTEALLCTGSDGLPLKRLPCGHVFDDTCWAAWIKSGHHNADKCPICQHNIGAPTAVPRRGITRSTMFINHDATTATISGSSHVRPHASRWFHGNVGTTKTISRHDIAGPTPTMSYDATTATVGSTSDVRPPGSGSFHRTGWDWDARNRALRQYSSDRNFRLQRLSSLYPQYIKPQQIQSWTQDGYDGTLAQDPSFTENNPALPSPFTENNPALPSPFTENNPALPSTSSGFRRSGRSGSSGFRRSGRSGSSGFGGGSSGGGRGGRW